METRVPDVHPQGKQLSGIRRVTKVLEGNSLKLAARVLNLIYGADHDYVVKAIRIHPNNAKIMIYDEKLRLIGVWQDPPGVCRKPRKGEK
jgi:hypothetical protein